MADFGVSEAILLAEAAGEAGAAEGAVGLASLPASVLTATEAFGAPLAEGLMGSGATGIAGLSGAEALTGAGLTPYQAMIEGGMNPALAQTQMETIANPGSLINQAQNVSNLGYNQADLDRQFLEAFQNPEVSNAPTYAPTASTNTVASDVATEPLVKQPTEAINNSPFQLRDTTGTQGIDNTAKLQGYRSADVGDLYKPIFDTSPTSVVKPAAESGGFSFGSMLPDSTMGKVGLGLTGLLAYDRLFGPKYGTPKQQPYSGALSKFKYSPSTYTPITTTPNVYRPVYAAGGGLMEGDQGIAGLSANPNFPMANQQTSRYAVPSQMPIGANDVRMAHMQPIAMAKGGSADTIPTPNPAVGDGTGFGAIAGLMQNRDFLASRPELANLNRLVSGIENRFGVNQAPTPAPVVQAAAPVQPNTNIYHPQYMASGGEVPSFAMGGLSSFLNNVNSNLRFFANNPSGSNRQFFADPRLAPVASQAPSPVAVAQAMEPAQPNTNIYHPQYAAGGQTHSDLGGYSDGGRMLKGPGDGMSDSIPASIGGKQPARLADGEFVIPADVVSHLGNGSTDAGAKQLYKMMDKVRTARTGRKTQGKQINPKKYMPR